MFSSVLPSSQPVFSSVALLLEELSCASSTFCELNILLMTVQSCTSRISSAPPLSYVALALMLVLILHDPRHAL
jgi:hypothetical protein